MLLISIAVPVGAGIFDIDVPENILKVYEEHFKLDTEGESQSEDLDTLLLENDLTDVVLPYFLFVDCEIKSFQQYNDNFIDQIIFEYVDKDQNFSGSVTLTTSDDHSGFLDGEMMVDGQYDEAKQLDVNGINVVVFNKGEENLIVYQISGVEYSIILKGTTFDKAVEIAGTL